MQRLREVHGWTPRQFCQDVTIPQLACLWLENEAHGRRKVDIEEAIELLKQRGKKGR